MRKEQPENNFVSGWCEHACWSSPTCISVSQLTMTSLVSSRDTGRNKRPNDLADVVIPPASSIILS